MPAENLGEKVIVEYKSMKERKGWNLCEGGEGKARAHWMRTHFACKKRLGINLWHLKPRVSWVTENVVNCLFSMIERQDINTSTELLQSKCGTGRDLCLRP